MGRPPIGKRPMTSAERQQRFWAKRLHAGAKGAVNIDAAPEIAALKAENAKLQASFAKLEKENADLRDQLKQRAKTAAPDSETTRELRDEIRRLRSECDRYFRAISNLEESNRKLRMRKGLLTQSQFNHLRACLHTDSRKQITDEKLTKTRMAIEALEKVLVKPKGAS